MRNRGELAEGWYDPSTLQKAIASSAESMQISRDSNSGGQSGQPRKEAWREERPGKGGFNSSSDSDDSVGPALPGKESRSRVTRAGPSIPNMEDLEFKRGFVRLIFHYKTYTDSSRQKRRMKIC